MHLKHIKNICDEQAPLQETLAMYLLSFEKNLQEIIKKKYKE